MISPVVFEAALTVDQIASLSQVANERPPSIDDQTVRGNEARYAQARWLARCVRTKPLFDIVERLMRAANEFYGFEVDEIHEPLLHATYPVGGHFSWHTDTGPGAIGARKLSLSILLSAPGSFEGGALEFCPGGRMVNGQAQGTAVVFPSFMAHRVCPVTRGERSALVAWMHGTPFQ